MACRKLVPIMLIISAIHCVSSDSGNQWINGKVFEKYFKDFIEKTLATSEFQDHIESKQLEQKPLDGQAVLDKLASITENRFRDISNAVSRIQSTLQKDYQNGFYNKTLAPNDSRQCCMTDLDELIMSYEFMKKLDPTQMCMRISQDTEDNPVIPLSNDLLEVMQNNRQENNDIKWQYFGTEEGVFVKYPRQVDQKCDYYEPRYRPWYAETLSGYPKDVVILFDRSKQIQDKGLLSYIKSASDALIQTLNVDDRLGMVAFNEKTSRPPGGNKRQYCYYENLAFATSDTKEYLKTWYHGLAGEGLSDYTKAFSTAFMYFNNSRSVAKDHRPRTRVIILITDGIQRWSARSTSEGILDEISKRNAELNNTVIITAFGIGEDMSPDEEMLLRNISLQTKADTTKGQVKPGQFVKLTSTKNLRVQVGSYYRTLNEWQSVKPIVTTPYVDFSGLGVVISICLPVDISQQLKGVTCIDVSLEEITPGVASLHHGRNAYFMKYDYKGRIILHPLMPDAVTYNRTIYLDVTDLERSAEFKQIMDSINRNISGSLSFVKDFIQSRGNTTTDGIKTVSLNATYYWISASDFNIVLVISDRDVNITVPPPLLSSNRFTYHRLDLVDDVQKCSSYGRLSTTDSTVVKLTKDAFQRNLYYYEPDTKENVAIYKSYMEDPYRRYNDRLRTMTKQMVAISEYLEPIWKELGNMNGAVIWRYYGDYYGHIRIYPGLTLPNDYDHTERSFFLKSVNNKDVITITPPYLDAFGAGIVVSVVVPIFPKSPNNQNDVEEMAVLGVLAVDIKMQFIKQTVENLFPVCLQSEKVCFIMDTSGYLIYHSEADYEIDDRINEVYSYHITELEPQIATYLIEEKFLVSQSCIDFGYKKILQTWRVENVSWIPTYDRSPYFDMYKVSGTNLFIAIKDKGHPWQGSCTCPKRTLPNYGTTLYSCTDNQCTCPCVDDVDYDYCRNQFLYDEAKQLACVPQPKSIGFKTPIPELEETAGNLTRCFECDSIHLESVCKLFESCSWCADICVQGQCPSTSSAGNRLLIGLITGGILLFLFIISLLIYARNHKELLCNTGTVPRPGEYQPDSDELSVATLDNIHPASNSKQPPDVVL